MPTTGAPRVAVTVIGTASDAGSASAKNAGSSKPAVHVVAADGGDVERVHEPGGEHGRGRRSASRRSRFASVAVRRSSTAIRIAVSHSRYGPMKFFA